jgi:predicted ATPase
LVGREREIAAVRELLQEPEVRLLTLKGLGGFGKMRLAIEVRAALEATFADGAVFVDLSSVRVPDLVLTEIARSLSVQGAGDRPLRERLRALLRDRELLIVFDNVEHVVTAAIQLSDLLSACPHLRILATSRESFRVRGEHENPVQPLEVTVDAADLLAAGDALYDPPTPS